VIITFNAVATSASYVDHPGSLVPPPPVPQSVTVTLASEVFLANDQTFTGTLFPDTIDLSPFHRFVPYFGYPSPQTIALLRIEKLIREFSHIRSITSDDFKVMSHISTICSTWCCLARRCCRNRHRNRCHKSELLKYFAFVCCSLRCLPKLDCNPKYVCALADACRSCDNSVSVFAALLVRVCASICVKSDVSQCVQSHFDTITGYNPYCCPSGSPASLYCLSGRDAAVVAKSSVCAEVVAEVEVVAVEEEERSSFSSEEEVKGRRHERPRKPFASRYKWHITVTVAVLVVASASAYAFVM